MGRGGGGGSPGKSAVGGLRKAGEKRVEGGSFKVGGGRKRKIKCF